VSKGALTRQTILEHAASLSTQIGLEGLSIGRLATDLGLSKSGLFAHFQSKVELELQVLDFAVTRFVDTVVRPSLAAPRGEPRVRALYEHWTRWPKLSNLPGGCFFVAAASELDDRPGPVRDRLVQSQRDWFDVIRTTVRGAMAEGHFGGEVDPDQFVQELYGIMLAYHHAWRLLEDRMAGKRARRAFEALLERARKR
jgi:AcrR family transcriptional regulator